MKNLLLALLLAVSILSSGLAQAQTQTTDEIAGALWSAGIFHASRVNSILKKNGSSSHLCYELGRQEVFIEYDLSNAISETSFEVKTSLGKTAYLLLSIMNAADAVANLCREATVDREKVLARQIKLVRGIVSAYRLLEPQDYPRMESLLDKKNFSAEQFAEILKPVKNTSEIDDLNSDDL